MYIFGRIVIAVCLLTLSGCASIAYYWQGAAGQLQLWERSEPITDVLARRSTDPSLKRKLELVLSIREFASRELALPDNRSYRLYADIERQFVVWNVFAAPELSLQAKQWCFPIAGCVSYRGYFHRNDAESEAQNLRDQGYDVHIGGVPAYSTLGYLNDPVLNTFVRYPDYEIARLIFHELAHQLLYVKGDSTFNESYAVTIEEEGVRRWISKHGDPTGLATFQRAQQLRKGFADLIQEYRGKLQMLYSKPLPPELMRAQKRQIFNSMRDDYAHLKIRWGGWSGYDRWFAHGPNNASIVSVGLYSQDVPAFQELLRQVNGDLPQFYRRAREIGILPADQRATAIALLTQQSENK